MKVIERFFDSLIRNIEVWDSENENAFPVHRDDVIELYFIDILRSVPDLEKVDFINEFFKRMDEKLL